MGFWHFEKASLPLMWKHKLVQGPKASPAVPAPSSPGFLPLNTLSQVYTGPQGGYNTTTATAPGVAIMPINISSTNSSTVSAASLAGWARVFFKVDRFFQSPFHAIPNSRYRYLGTNVVEAFVIFELGGSHDWQAIMCLLAWQHLLTQTKLAECRGGAEQNLIGFGKA